MKIISILIPTYNEEENIRPLSQAILEEFHNNLPDYSYEIVFIDNDSKDDTRSILRDMCSHNKNIKAIFNAKNFGQFNSPYYGLLQTSGHCTILMCADFQDPINMISQFVREWEKGYKIVIGKKTTSKESKIMYFLRSCYYKLIKKISDVEQIEHFTGFGLYDREFIDVLRNLDDPTPFLRGIVAELGFKRKEISYEQQKRRAGKTSNNFYRLYDAAMLSFTSYTKIGLRMSIGAKGRDILAQFLIEAILISITGGIIGVLFGFVSSYAVKVIAGWPIYIQVWSVILSFAVCTVTGVFFGWYPAKKAANLDPIEAIRYE